MSEIERFISSLSDNGLTRRQTLLRTFSSLMEAPSINAQTRSFWVKEYFHLGELYNEPDVCSAVLDYLKIPSDLSIKERIAFYKIMSSEVKLDE